MPFTKGNNLWDNPRVKAYQFKEGERISLSTEFKAGFAPWNKGLKGYKAGESHYKWKVDRTQLARKQERNDGAYKEWRRQVWVRDGYKCKISNLDCAGRIEAHHILGWTKYPELRFEILGPFGIGATVAIHAEPKTAPTEGFHVVGSLSFRPGDLDQSLCLVRGQLPAKTSGCRAMPTTSGAQPPAPDRD